MKMKRQLILFFYIILVNTTILYSQKGLHIGLAAGPSHTLFKGPMNLPPELAYSGRTSGSQSFKVEYGLTDFISIRGSINNNLYGFKTSLDSPEILTLNGINSCSQTEMIGFNYFGADIGLKSRIPFYRKRVFLVHSFAVGLMPTWSGTVSVTDFSLNGCINGYAVKNKLTTPRPIYLPTVALSAGAEYRFYKGCYVMVDLYYQKGFKEIAYLNSEALVNNVTYTNRLSSDGSLFGLSIGIKVPLFNKYKTPIDTGLFANGSYDTTDYNHLKLRYKRGVKLMGINTRLFDRAGTIVPFNVGFQLQYYYFIRDRLAIGAVGIVKIEYSDIYKANEYIAGASMRYYVKKISNWNAFLEANVLAGYNQFYRTPIHHAIAVAPGISAKLGGNWSMETSVKFIYPFYTPFRLAGKNTLVNIGLNYHL